MFIRSKVLLLSLLTLSILVCVIGCDQPVDVVTPNSSTNITLNPERLPNNPAGTVYELWVANNTDTLSLGRFGYDYSTRNFLTELGADRPEEGRFLLDASVEPYTNIFVSVEPTIVKGDDLTSPASIMLIDYTTSPTVKLVTPMIDSLWSSTLRYNMKSPSDGPGFGSDGKSIWFCNYRTTNLYVHDTSGITWSLDSGAVIDSLVDSLETAVVDTMIDTVVAGVDTTYNYTYDTLSIDTIFTLLSDTIPVGVDWYLDSAVVVLGADDSTGVGIDSVYRDKIVYSIIDSVVTYNYYPTTLNLSFTSDSVNYFEERFAQDDFEMPNLQQYGWKYKGWVVADEIPAVAVGSEITLPAWTFLDPYLTKYSGGMLTTGKFYNVKAQDLENPYVDTTYRNPARIPLFPGEDFILNLPAGLGSMPYLANGNGHVFVTLEPEFYEDTTNFPLFAFIGDLVDGNTVTVTGTPISTAPFTLDGFMYHNDPYRGFPLIWVTIEKE